MNINALLSSSEGKTLEFKRNLSSPKPILKTLVAFANTAGGTLIIGRADDDFKAGVSHVRNIVISRVLHELGLMEQWGVSEKTAKRDIAALRKKELIVFVGAPKTGRYQLKGSQ